MIHLKFFDYVFYRIATTKYFQKVDPKTPYIWAFGWTQFCELLNILTIVAIYQKFTNGTFNDINLVLFIAIPLSIVNVFFITTKKKYEWLIEHYKNEKNKKLKGWGVFSYVIISMFLFGYIGIKLFWVPATSFS